MRIEKADSLVGFARFRRSDNFYGKLVKQMENYV